MGLFSWLTRARLPAAPDAVDILSPRHKANLYPFYARLRAEAPVYATTLPGGQRAWLITRYADVVAVLKDERFAKDRSLASKPLWIPGPFREPARNMLHRDGADHTRLRALVQKAFSPRLVERMRPRVQDLADGLLDAAQGCPCLDLVRDYAQPIPTTIIAEMLGVPVRDRHRFQRWSRAIISINFSFWGIVTAIPSLWALMRYIRRLVRARRAAPRDDLVSALVHAREAGEQLSEGEVVGMVILLLVAGHETTVHLIGNGMLALLQHPAQLEKLQSDPSLIRSAVEELLRFDGPLETATDRFATEDLTVAGVTIPRGEMVFAAIGSANRDEREFADPDTLDITREPNRHLAFGLGLHFCLGAALARLEGQVAINTLLRRAARLRLAVAPEALRWRRGLAIHGLEGLPVVVDRWADGGGRQAGATGRRVGPARNAELVAAASPLPTHD
jgi:cytochrome P450 PksS